MMRPPSSAAPAVVLRGANPAWDVVRIPESSHTLAGFRTWADSEQFPESGRIDFLGGDVEVDVSPEDLHTHGTLKAALAAALFGAVARSRRGHVFVDRTRVTSREADLSVEPDLVAVLFTSLDAGRVRQVPSARGGDRFIELEGAPDLVVEIVSDTSERKDTERLPPRYARAGIPELWLIDARGGELRFEVRRLVAGTYRRVPPDPIRWVSSPLLGRVRLAREATPHSGWLYELEIAG
jgi:Uma2 family endonuclease